MKYIISLLLLFGVASAASNNYDLYEFGRTIDQAGFIAVPDDGYISLRDAADNNLGGININYDIKWREVTQEIYDIIGANDTVYTNVYNGGVLPALLLEDGLTLYIVDYEFAYKIIFYDQKDMAKFLKVAPLEKTSAWFEYVEYK